jgi:hypothetical protein
LFVFFPPFFPLVLPPKLVVIGRLRATRPAATFAAAAAVSAAGTVCRPVAVSVSANDGATAGHSCNFKTFNLVLIFYKF